MSRPPFGSPEWFNDFRAYWERERLRPPPQDIDFWVANQQQREELEEILLAYYQKTYGPSVKVVTIEELRP